MTINEKLDLTLEPGGSLRDFLPRKKRDPRLRLRVATTATIKDVAESAGIPHTEIKGVERNGREVFADDAVKQGDVLRLYPYTVFDTGVEPLHFAVDCNVAKCVKYLRMLGFSVYFENDIADGKLARVAAEQERIVLTRDKRLLMRKIIARGRYVRAVRAEEQLKELVAFFNLKEHMRPFTRCMVCDTPLREAEKAAVLDRLPPKVAAGYEEFKYCDKCDKVYWKGTHFKRMFALLKRL